MRPYYDNGTVAIYHGDCINTINNSGESGFDTVLTDPPYSSGARMDTGRQTVHRTNRSEKTKEEWFSHDNMTTWGFSWFLRNLFVTLRPHLVGGAHVYSFIDWRQLPNLYGLLESTGYRVNHCLVWDKEMYSLGTYWRGQYENIVFASLGMPHPMPDRRQGTVLRCKRVTGKSRYHPTEKPVDLLETILRSTNAQRVIDPFMGVGSTLLAAQKLGIKAVGCEIEEQYCEIAANRLNQQLYNKLTQETPT